MIVELEKRVKNLEVGRKSNLLGGEGEGVEIYNFLELMMEKVRTMEWKMEWKERKKNVVIKRLRVVEGNMREEIERR